MSAPPAYELFSVNDTYFNSFIIETFLIGLYTIVFGQALWSLQEQDKRASYRVALIFLWICVMVNFALDWEIARSGFVVNNSTPLAIANALRIRPDYMLRVESIALTLAIAIADGLLVWRCTVLWNGSKWILSILSVLFFAALGGNIWWIITAIPSGDSVLTAQTIGFTASAALSICATSLIALRIWLSTRHSPVRGFYTRIIEILIESAALYSIVTLIAAVSTATIATHPLLTLSTAFGRRINGLNIYSACIQTAMIGLAPTLLVLRIGKKGPQLGTSPTNPLSHLTFRRSERMRPNGTLSAQISVMGLGDDDIADISRSVDAHAQFGNGDGTGLAKSSEKIMHNQVGSEYI